ncbi:class I SAM-dependent methyltransferase [Pseudoteredinibacter isoporae]|uniref:SAM-dependent methyltransferase n=1 Tax=Pseudoteredinibacter isoporae TaxID=570281 RepID=A0A7X0MWY2_9GAMM|nr:class I SAM-dependent methyltransferase [Pseudoteredinibacter isoporae]MBB6522705.1 SAM-dependent methyltransferase [Pseudoteredinibacter isoporae]NHO88235.1 class I SAM-dependent methyltransferase [Pseudoteredinibacter isoporae]NIB23434.1 class I SAM-dependent methyltransferase [Pseudoteredinibacter isoporae]
MSKESKYWDELAELGENQSVFDPRDRFGKKNAYIRYLRDKELNTFFSDAFKHGPVFDFGCGSGNISMNLNSRGIDTFGIDISEGLLRIARNQSPQNLANFCQFDGVSIPVAEGVFSDVVVYVVLSYIKDDDALREVVSQLYNSLKRGGSFLLIEQTRKIRKQVDEFKVIRTKREYRSLFSDIGFECLEQRDMRSGHFLPLYFLSLGVSLPFSLLHRIESFQHKVVPNPVWDYRETVFRFVKHNE